MDSIAIRARGLGKRYTIGGQQASDRTLRDVVAEAAARPMRMVRKLARREAAPGPSETIWALKDLSLDVLRGEVVGIVGKNGAGKSTLLKVLSRITVPTEGRAEVFGRVGSLLEVGTGFHAELSGRENVYLNGAVLGMKRREIRRQFDAIVDFAEVARFIDTPVKRYSSGMYLRLAFAVAAHLNPDILIVDEVLAVGDAAFQKRCLAKMDDVAHTGRTVLFVSHNMGAIQGLCQRAIWIDQGTQRDDGPPAQIIASYLASISTTSDLKRVLVPLGDLEIMSVALLNEAGVPSTEFRVGEPLTVEIRYCAHKPIERAAFWLSVDWSYGSLFTANMLIDGKRPPTIEGNGSIRCRFDHLPILPNMYSICMGVRDKTGAMLVRTGNVAGFTIVDSAEDLGLTADNADAYLRSTGPVPVPYEWSLPGGRTERIDILGPVMEQRPDRLPAWASVSDTAESVLVQQ